jgi:hypothetical protein
MRFAVKPVEDQILRDMRHKVTCHVHNGQIASCGKCSKYFSINEIVKIRLSIHFGKSKNQFQFPERWCQPLDRIVYEMGKDFLWIERNDYNQLIRYFAGNAITNVHLTKHTQRCFKKGAECYANLPDGISQSDKTVYSWVCDVWSDCFGNKEDRYMLRFQPKGLIEDVFMNIHNPTITRLLMCNNNIQVGMNGRSILSITPAIKLKHSKKRSDMHSKMYQTCCAK